MQNKSLVKNAIFNFTYTGLKLVFPLLTAPYISRTLGASNLGKVNFASSIINWFILFAVFGTATYGVREVARNRDNQKELNKIFSEIVIINGFLSIIVSMIYFILIFNIDQFKNELILYMIMSISIILNMFAIDWFYQGIEEYSYITIRSTIFKIISLICIFLFVRDENHYIIYAFLSVIISSLSGFLNYIYSKKYVKFTIKNIHPLRHVKSLNVFFLHSLIISTYTNLDQTLLGFLVDNKSVAFVTRSKTITNLAIAVSTSITNVTLPRASYYINNNELKFRELLTKIPNFILWITIPITVGCLVLAHNIMYILGGLEFQEAALLLQITSLIVIFSPLSGYLQNQVMVPTGNEKIGLNAAIFTSVVSILCNILLIPTLGYIGSGITIVLAEFSAVTLRYYIVKRKLNYVDIHFINKSSIKYVLTAILMGIVVFLINNVVINVYIATVLSIVIGATFYFCCLILLKEEVMLLITKKIFKKF